MAQLRLLGASPVKMAVRKVFLTCTWCGKSFTVRGNGMEFNADVLTVSNNRGKRPRNGELNTRKGTI
jgi:transcription elongation factor Elf1